MFTDLTEVLIFAFAFWATSKVFADIKIDSIWSVPVAALVYMITDRALTGAYSFLFGLLPVVPAFLLEVFVLPSTVWLSFKITTALVSGYRVESGAAMFWAVIIVSVIRTLLGFLFL